MDAIDRLVALEDIRKVKARRVRCMDEKDWAGYAACHTDDAVSHSLSREGGAPAPVVGAHEIARKLSIVLEGKTTVHHLHAPEIDLLSDQDATGIWPMEDMLFWEEQGVQHRLHGYGHYRETYRKVDGQWLISSRDITRIRVDTWIDHAAES